MKTFLTIGLILFMVGGVFAANPDYSASGFSVGEVTHTGNEMSWLPTSFVARITGVTAGSETTTFQVETLKDIGEAFGSVDLSDYFNAEWSVVAHYCTNVTAGIERDITDYVVGTGQVVTAAADGNWAVGDVIMFMVKDLVGVDEILDVGWQHLSVTTGLQSVDSTWSSVATHEVFDVTGPIEAILTVWCDVSGDGADSLTILLAGQTPFTAIEKVDFDAGEIMSINTAPVANVAWVKMEVDPVVAFTPVDVNSLVQSQIHFVNPTGLDIGYEIEIASMIAGQVTFNLKWRPLDTGTKSTVTAGAGGTL
jgi:hypothetical protein